MAFEPKYERMVSGYRKKLGTTQAVIECKLPANENSEINKIICANAKAYIKNSQISDNNVLFSGFVNFQVIYESNTVVAEGLDYSAEFSDKFAIQISDGARTPVVTCAVVDVTTNKTSQNDIKVVAIVEIYVDVIVNNELSSLVGISGDNVFTASEEMSFHTFTEVIKDNYELPYDVEIQDKVSSILSVVTSAYIDSVTPFNKYIMVKGGINVDICYLSDDETPKAVSYQTSIDFAREIASEAVIEESYIQSEISIAVNDIKITTNIDDKNSVINFIIPIIYNGYLFNKNVLNVVVDAFSIENYLNVNSCSLSSIVPNVSKSYVEKISGSVEVSEDMPFIDEVLGNCCNNVTLASAFVDNGKIIVEGIAYTTVVYLNKEYNTINSIDVELPFSLNLDNLELPANTEISAILSLGDVAAKSRRGKEIDVNAKLFIFLDMHSSKTDAIICEISLGEEKTANNSALTIYFVKDGDTIWDIAKNLSVAPEVILNQNPEEAINLTPGSKLFVYRERIIQF